MADDDICLEPAASLAARIRRREISSRELTAMFLARIARINPVVNAVVTLDEPGVLAAADAADRRTAAADPAELGPLHGLPATIKDAIEVAGMRSTGGSEALRDHIPDRDAPVVARLRRAGALIAGKTNVPEWSGDVQTYNPLFGATNNPWDLSVTTGGSSGGPAAAVATGMTAFEVGTDIGGSIRIPSSFCGIFGHKPSFGVVPQRGYLDSVGGGVIDADMNVFGPLGRSTEDLEVLLGVLAGPADEDARAWRLELPPPRHDDLAGFRVGLWLDDPACEVEGAAVELLASAASSVEKRGATVTRDRPPLDLAEVRELFEQLLIPAVSVSFDGEMGDALGGNHRHWLDRTRHRTLVRQVWARWFEDHDVLLCPVMPMLPFPHDHSGSVATRSVVINGQDRPQAGTLAWTGLVGVAYLPSTVVPLGLVDGRPVGVQVVGPYLHDRTCLRFAAHLAELTGGYRPPPLAVGPPAP